MFLDMCGNEIEVGSRVVASFVASSSGYLRIGEVVELVPERPMQYGGEFPAKIRVAWDSTRRLYGGNNKTLITIGDQDYDTKVLVIGKA